MKRIVLAGLLLSGALHAQWATHVKSVEVAPGVYMIDGADGSSGGNIALLTGDEHTLLIDDSITALSQSVLDTATEVAGKPIDFLINTHVHGDHVGSNALLAENGALIVAHDNIRRRLVDKPEDAGGPGGLPVVTFSDAVTFHINGHEAYVFHVKNAHTDGDAVIHFRDMNIIHTGDLLFNNLFPFIDLDSGGTVEGYIAGQQEIIAAADDETVIIPGHGPVASKGDLQASNDMLVDARAKVKALVEKGLSQEEVLAGNPLADYHDEWNWGFITTERMTNTLYRSLTQE